MQHIKEPNELKKLLAPVLEKYPKFEYGGWSNKALIHAIEFLRKYGRPTDDWNYKFTLGDLMRFMDHYRYVVTTGDNAQEDWGVTTPSALFAALVIAGFEVKRGGKTRGDHIFKMSFTFNPEHWREVLLPAKTTETV
jgi:hypothetical protein